MSHVIASNLPLYATAFLAALLTAFWPQSNAAQSMIVAYNMPGFTVITLVILLVERLPELLVFPAGCAAAAIWLWYPRLDFTSLMVVYTGLCVLVLATQFIWRVFPHRQLWLAATTLHEVLGIGGQALVVAVILTQGGFASRAHLRPEQRWPGDRGNAARALPGDATRAYLDDHRHYAAGDLDRADPGAP